MLKTSGPSLSTIICFGGVQWEFGRKLTASVKIEIGSGGRRHTRRALMRQLQSSCLLQLLFIGPTLAAATCCGGAEVRRRVIASDIVAHNYNKTMMIFDDNHYRQITVSYYLIISEDYNCINWMPVVINC